MLGVLLVLAAGCETDHWASDGGAYDLGDPGLTLETGGVYAGGPILAGTHACLTAACLGEACPETDEDRAAWAQEAEACLEWGASGAASVGEDGCIGFDGPGEAVVELEPAGCEGDWADTFVSDTSTLPVVDPIDVHGAFSSHLEDAAEDLLEPVSEVGWPADWKLSDHEVAQVVAETPVAIDVALFQGVGGAGVGWHSEDGSFQVETLDGSALDHERVGEAQIGVAVPLGGQVQVGLEVAGNTWVAGQLVGVDVDDITELELVIGIGDWDESDGERLAPVGGRAVARDAAREVVFGPPVTWHLDEGDVVVESFATEEGYQADYAWILDVCDPPSESYGTRSAVVRVSLGDLEDTVTVTWDGLYASEDDVPADADDDWEIDERCPGFDPGDIEVEGWCGCGTRGTAPGAGFALLTLLVVARRRRRAA